MSTDFTCNWEWIKLDVPHQIWEAQTADGIRAHTFLTRLFHNKFLFYPDNILRCYLSYLSPDFITGAFSFIGMVFFLAGVFYLVFNRRWLLLAVLLIVPLLPLFKIPNNISAEAVILYVVEGLVIIYAVWQLVYGIFKIFLPRK